MSEKYAGPATSTCEHCHISEICYPFRWHRLSLAVLFVRGSIIVTACCMAHQTNLYLNYNEFRIISPELYCKFRDVRMHLRYCISFIGCRWNRVVQTGSHYIQGPCTVDSKLFAQSTDSPQLHEDVALIRSAVIVHSSCSDSNRWTCFSRCSSIDLEHSTTSCLFL